MRKLLIIGTLHAGMTSHAELIEVLERLAPDQLVVEIVEEDRLSGEIASYPPEMIAALRWAERRGIPVRGFDSRIDELAEGLTEDDNQRAIEEDRRAMDGLAWKDFNQEENLRRFDGTKWLLDPVKMRQRTKEMEENLQRVMAAEGTVVVVTGCGHLDDLRKAFPEAKFPLADEDGA